MYLQIMWDHAGEEKHVNKQHSTLLNSISLNHFNATSLTKPEIGEAVFSGPIYNSSAQVPLPPQ